MDHVAILNKKMASVADILSGTKTIESRWYKNKINPWNNIKIGDKVFFKQTGDNVTAVATVAKVIQIDSLNEAKFKEIIDKYNDKILLRDTSYHFYKDKRYAILIFLKNPHAVKPFRIDKRGFGSSCAWLCVDNINKIKR